MQMKCCVVFLINLEHLLLAGFLVTFSKARHATMLRIRVVLQTSSSFKGWLAYKALVNECCTLLCFGSGFALYPNVYVTLNSLPWTSLT